MDYQNLVAQLRNTQSVSKRKMLDAAADAIEQLSARRYTAHEVAEILADFTGDECACNYNGNDEWLPEWCELTTACPNPVGVACWEQYLKYLDRRIDDG